MNLNELKKMIKKVLNETVNDKTIIRMREISDSIGNEELLAQIAKKLDDNILMKVLDEISVEFDLKRKDLPVQDAKLNEPTGKAEPHNISRFAEPGSPFNLKEDESELSGWEAPEEEKKGMYNAIEKWMNDPANNDWYENHPSNPKNKEKELEEKHLTKAETGKKEEIVKAMKSTKDKVNDLKSRYGDNWKNVVYAIATKKAKELAESGDVNLQEISKNLARKAYNAANRDLAGKSTSTDPFGVRKREIQSDAFLRYINPEIKNYAKKLRVGLEAPSEDIVLAYISGDGSATPYSFQEADVVISVNVNGQELKKGDAKMLSSNYTRALAQLLKKIQADFQDKPKN